MTFDEFLAFRDVKIKNEGHERIVRLFFPYMESVSGDARLLPDLLGRIIGADTSATAVPSACVNDISDGTEPPYPDVDFYARLGDGTRIFVYHSVRSNIQRVPKKDESVVFLTRNCLSGTIDRRDGYILLS